jgi:hypothetical protein
MIKRKWFLPVVVIGLFLVGIVVKSAFTHASQIARPAYTLRSQATQYDSDGTARSLYVETLYVSASGNWHSVKQYAGGVKEAFGEVGQGVFSRRDGDNELGFVSKYDSLRPILTADGFLKSSDFLRTETILGYPAFVTKAQNNSQVEFYCAPIIGGANIKIVNKSDETKTVVTEPLGLVFGEPEPSLVKRPADLPVNYDNFNKLHGQP